MTGSHLKIKSMGDNVLGVSLAGNPNKPEPIHFRVVLPFGDVDIVRCTDGSYWVHTRVVTPDDGLYVPGQATGAIIDGRVDVHGKHGSECSCGDLEHPKAYHVAVKVGPILRA